MMIISKIRQLDAKTIDDFKKDYLDSPKKGLCERNLMTTMGVFFTLITIAHQTWYLILIFTGISAIFSIWAYYAWRTYFILRKEGLNLGEPMFIYGPVNPLRICVFIPAFIVMIALLFMPQIFTMIFGYCDYSILRPIDVLVSIAFGIVMVEYWRFALAVKNWSMHRHFVFVLFMAVACLAFILYTAHIHRPPHFTDFM